MHPACPNPACRRSRRCRRAARFSPRCSRRWRRLGACRPCPSCPSTTLGCWLTWRAGWRRCRARAPTPTPRSRCGDSAAAAAGLGLLLFCLLNSPPCMCASCSLQEASQATADAAKQLAAADQGADPQAWHRLAWLSEQQPLVEARIADVGGKLAPAAGSVEALQALLRRIEDEKVRWLRLCCLPLLGRGSALPPTISQHLPTTMGARPLCATPHNAARRRHPPPCSRRWRRRPPRATPPSAG